VQLAAVGQIEERAIRRLGPQEVRKPRRQRDIVYRVVVTRLRGDRHRLDPKQKARADENCLQCHANAALEAPLRATLLVELHQIAQLGRRRSAAIGRLGEMRDDPLSAQLFF
jgi:hypothetical protein